MKKVGIDFPYIFSLLHSFYLRVCYQKYSICKCLHHFFLLHSSFLFNLQYEAWNDSRVNLCKALAAIFEIMHLELNINNRITDCSTWSYFPSLWGLYFKWPHSSCYFFNIAGKKQAFLLWIWKSLRFKKKKKNLHTALIITVLRRLEHYSVTLHIH